jgi:hypothetical protein
VLERAVKIPAGRYTVAAPVRRPSNPSPTLARAWSCQATRPLRGLSATTTPSENLTITSATPS